MMLPVRPLRRSVVIRFPTLCRDVAAARLLAGRSVDEFRGALVQLRWERGDRLGLSNRARMTTR